MTEDLKKPQPDDVPGQLLLEVRLQLEEENAKLRKEIRDLKAWPV